MLNTGLETGMQIMQDVMSGEPLKKAAKSRAKAAEVGLIGVPLCDLFNIDKFITRRIIN